jgi:uncharacterized protein DUF4333
VRRITASSVVALALAVTACGRSAPDFQSAAQRVIEGDLESQIGLGPLEGSCEEPSSRDVGATFKCTATTEDGQTITIEATIEDDDRVGVQTTNLLTVDNLATIEAEAARLLTEQVGQELPAQNIDCGDQPRIAEVGKAFTCALIDPGDPSKVYDTAITIDDLTKPSHIDVQVADAPRG